MGKIRVLRGRTEAVNIVGGVNLIQDDHRFNHGFIIRKFLVAIDNPHSSTASSRDCYAVLATSEEGLWGAGALGTVVNWNWDDRRQVAWASTNIPGDSVVEQTFELIDPTHIILRDLWFGVTALTASAGNDFVYYIELEQVELTDNQAVMAIVQEEAQDVN